MQLQSADCTGMQGEHAQLSVCATQLWCSAHLPSHMVPRHWHTHTRLPKTPNDKVDVRALQRHHSTRTIAAKATGIKGVPGTAPHDGGGGGDEGEHAQEEQQQQQQQDSTVCNADQRETDTSTTSTTQTQHANDAARHHLCTVVARMSNDALVLDDTSAVVLDVWMRVLHMSSIADALSLSFFDCGGDSLTALRFVNKLRPEFVHAVDFADDDVKRGTIQGWLSAVHVM